MKNIFKQLLLVLSLISTGVFAQSVGVNNPTPDPSAALDVVSTTKGVLVPRLTAAQRTLITNPATGLLVYQTDEPSGFYFYANATWTLLGATGPQGAKGDQGLQGPKGDAGTNGLAGEKGDKGDKGDKGEPGLQGPKGDQGIQGETGLQGPQGDKGDKGIQGETGLQGPKGDKGDQGIQGLQGPKGDAGTNGLSGIDGINGIDGLQGPKGDKGDQGIQGLQGPKGDKGDQGIQGETGLQGSKGDKGDQGIQGETGLQGLKGDKGDQGIQGETGLQGLKGDKGDQGVQGETGLQGAKGDKGDQGIQGETGLQGPKGDKGDQGEVGPSGPTGSTGPAGPMGAPGVQGLKGDKGDTGVAGQGVPIGGTTGQVLAKINGTDYNTQWVTPGAGGGGATVQLFANKVGGSSEILPVAGSTSPTTIVFNNVLNTPTLGTYNNSTGVFTVGPSGAGSYLVQVKLLCNDASPASSTVPPYLTLIKNNVTYGSNGADIFYGDYPTIHNVLPTTIKGQGSLNKVIQLAAGDTFRIVAVSANSSTAAQPTSTVAGSNITIMKL